MGARPSSFKRGGGFLNGVDGTIVDYVFTDEFNGEAFVPGRDPKTKKEKFHALYCLLSVQVDGADEPISTTLFVGGYDDWEIDESGKILTPTKDGQELGASASFCIFLASMVEAGFPEDRLPEDAFDFTAIVNTRGRFVQRTNVEQTKRLGKRKGKNGKEYDRQDLIMDQVYEVPDGEAEEAPAKPAAKGTAKPTAKPVVGKPAGKAKTPAFDVDDAASTLLLEILNDAKVAKGGVIAKAKLSSLTLQRRMKDPNRDAIRERIFSDDFLASNAGWTYNKAKGTITLDPQEEAEEE